MLCFWASKGGAGCSTVAAACALHAADGGRTLLVDLDGSLPTLLGVTVSGPGIGGWLAAPAPPPDALARIEVPISPHLSLLPLGGARQGGSGAGAAGTADGSGPGGARQGGSGAGGSGLAGDGAPGAGSGGGGPGDRDRWRLLARWLLADDRAVIVDLGTITGGAGDGGRPVGGRGEVLAAATRTHLVLRACYLAVVAAVGGPGADGVVVVREPGRALRDRDIAAAVGAPVVATVPWDAAVARAVDAGIMVRRRPRPLQRLRSLVDPPDHPFPPGEAAPTPLHRAEEGTGR